MAQGLTAEEQAELEALDAELSAFDSTSLIALVDSLIRLEASLNRSQIVVQAGYNNESLTNDQQSLGYENSYYTGASFYHKSGVFAQVTANWNSQFATPYYLTQLGAGYLGALGQHFSYSGNYSHFFFNHTLENDSVYFPFTDGFDFTFYYLSKYFESGLEYSAILGETTTSHKLTYRVIGNFELSHIGIIDKIYFRPSMALLWGNQSIYSIKIDRRFLDPRKRYSIVVDDVFGLMNISFMVPIYVRIGPVSVNAGYQFNLPQELPGERLNYSNSNVFFGGISYFIKL